MRIRWSKLRNEEFTEEVISEAFVEGQKDWVGYVEAYRYIRPKDRCYDMYCCRCDEKIWHCGYTVAEARESFEKHYAECKGKQEARE